MLSWDDVLVGSGAIIMCVPLISMAGQVFAVIEFEHGGLDKLVLLRTVLLAAWTEVVLSSESLRPARLMETSGHVRVCPMVMPDWRICRRGDCG